MILEWTSGAFDQRPRYVGLAQVLTWSGVVAIPVVTVPAEILATLTVEPQYAAALTVTPQYAAQFTVEPQTGGTLRVN